MQTSFVLNPEIQILPLSFTLSLLSVALSVSLALSLSLSLSLSQSLSLSLARSLSLSLSFSLAPSLSLSVFLSLTTQNSTLNSEPCAVLAGSQSGSTIAACTTLTLRISSSGSAVSVPACDLGSGWILLFRAIYEYQVLGPVYSG